MTNTNDIRQPSPDGMQHSAALPETAAPADVIAAKPHGWNLVRFLFKVVEIRLRFILILVATFVLIGKWDTIKNYWEKWTRPSATIVQAEPNTEYFCPMHPTVAARFARARRFSAEMPDLRNVAFAAQKGEACCAPQRRARACSFRRNEFKWRACGRRRSSTGL